MRVTHLLRVVFQDKGLLKIRTSLIANYHHFEPENYYEPLENDSYPSSVLHYPKIFKLFNLLIGEKVYE